MNGAALLERLRGGLGGFRGSLQPDQPLAPVVWFRAGGPAEMVVQVGRKGADTAAWPSLLPDGKHFVYLLRRFGSEQQMNEVRLGSLDGSVDKPLLSRASALACISGSSEVNTRKPLLVRSSSR